MIKVLTSNHLLRMTPHETDLLFHRFVCLKILRGVVLSIDTGLRFLISLVVNLITVGPTRLADAGARNEPRGLVPPWGCSPGSTAIRHGAVPRATRPVRAPVPAPAAAGVAPPPRLASATGSLVLAKSYLEFDVADLLALPAGASIIVRKAVVAVEQEVTCFSSASRGSGGHRRVVEEAAMPAQQ